MKRKIKVKENYTEYLKKFFTNTYPGIEYYPIEPEFIVKKDGKHAKKFRGGENDE